MQRKNLSKKGAYKPGLKAAVYQYVDKMFDLPFEIKQDKDILNLEKVQDLLDKAEDGISLVQIIRAGLSFEGDEDALAFMEKVAEVNPKSFQYNFGRFKRSIIGDENYGGMKAGEYRDACEKLIEVVDANIEAIEPPPPSTSKPKTWGK